MTLGDQVRTLIHPGLLEGLKGGAEFGGRGGEGREIRAFAE